VANPSPPESAPRTAFAAVLVNLLNPNPYLAWALVLGPAVVAAWRAHPGYGIALVVSFYVTMLVTLAAIVFLAGTARFLDAGRQHALVGVSALVLAGFGVTLLAVGVRGFWGGLRAG
jgi:threonine/homoserine/homoserine lactone efflux protein